MKKFFNFRPLFYCFLAFLSAILFARYIFNSNWVYIGILIAAIIALLVFTIIRKKFAMFLCVLLFFSAGLGGYAIEMSTYSVDNQPDNATIIAQVSGNINTTGATQKIVLNNVTINGNAISQNVLVTIYGAPYVSAGDIIEFVGDLSPSGATNYYGNFRSDYYKNNVRYLASIDGANVEIIGNKAGVSDKIQSAIKEKLYQNTTEENAAISYAMLFGDKSDIEDETLNVYRTSGIAHILAISGLHIGILVGFLYFILKKCRAKNWLSLIIISAILVFYCYLCGFSASVVRASVMSICLLISTLLGRRYDSLSAIGLAGLILLIIRPLYAFDIGFQLSFGCVVAMAIFYLPIFNILRRIKFPKWLASSLAISMSTQILTLPILVNTFNGVSFLSIFLNVLVVPVFSIAYIITFISTPLLFASDFFGNFLWFSGILMQGIRICANFVANLSWSVIPNIKFSFVWFIGFYIILFFASRLVFLKPQTKLIICSSIAIATISTVGILQLI